MKEQSKALQARFEQDPHGLARSEALLLSEGFEGLKLIKSQRRHHIFKGRSKDGELHFIKAAVDPGEYIFWRTK